MLQARAYLFIYLYDTKWKILMKQQASQIGHRSKLVKKNPVDSANQLESV
jgi:hypothetical protein